MYHYQNYVVMSIAHWKNGTAEKGNTHILKDSEQILEWEIPLEACDAVAKYPVRLTQRARYI